MQLRELADASAQVAATSGRLDKIQRLAACLRQAHPEEIEPAVSFLIGELPDGRAGIGPAAVREALATPSASEPRLSVAEVARTFQQLAQVRGKGSAAEKARQLGRLYGQATRLEQEFLSRLLLGELRQGALEGLVVEAVARAAQLPVAEVRRAVMLAGGLPQVARAALTGGAAGLAHFRIQLFRPLQPMLAQTADDVDSALAQLATAPDPRQDGLDDPVTRVRPQGRSPAALEFKLDGARIQVHKSGQEVRVFTRGMNDVSPALPEVVELVRNAAAPELILDGEVLALRPDGTPQPFQTTMRRFGRKQHDDELGEALPLAPAFFDCLYADGQPLIDEPTSRRIEMLAEVLPPDAIIPRLVTADPGEARGFLEQALERGHEGIMAKSLDAPYEAGSRGQSWLKIKPAHTLDLVVVAAEWGSGRRQGWLSNLHLAARNPADNTFAMIGKTFKGLTDEMLAWQTKRFLELELGREGHIVHVRPELVVEVAFNEIQTSRRYASGLALRFARVKRYRQDKSPQQADTLSAVRTIHQRGLRRGD